MKIFEQAFDLIRYGIFNEKSDIHAHVSVSDWTVYVFETQKGIDAINTGNFKCKPAYQVHSKTGIKTKTANGYPVPVSAISGMKSIRIPSYIVNIAKNIRQNDTTTRKGKMAVYVVKEMLKAGMIPIAAIPREITDQDMQIEGTDIMVTARCKVQVKCDWNAGKYGNVYLQTEERNINKAY